MSHSWIFFLQESKQKNSENIIAEAVSGLFETSGFRTVNALLKAQKIIERGSRRLEVLIYSILKKTFCYEGVSWN